MDDTTAPVSHLIDDAIDRARSARIAASDVMVRAVVTPPIVHAYHQGRHDALAELMPASHVAMLLGLKTTSRVHQLARARNVGWTIGRERLFTPADVEELRNRDTTPGQKPRRG